MYVIVRSRMSLIMDLLGAELCELFALEFARVPHGSVVRCLTRNPGVLGSSRTRSPGFFRGSVLGQDTSEPSPGLVKPRKA